ncbi:hypothetical protein EB796_007571 [Bugula neritina]|uniref:Uncharacterized protein n=1 Tax=Bugula neritina TaxID=10212 RepID=A0A7J7K685_BUGNE|nr:hypothetical protein EB796_007571 [Bugula neritina]
MGFQEDELVLIKYKIKVFSTVFFCLHLFTLILCGFTFFEAFYRQQNCISQPPQHESSSKESVTKSNIDDTIKQKNFEFQERISQGFPVPQAYKGSALLDEKSLRLVFEEPIFIEKTNNCLYDYIEVLQHSITHRKLLGEVALQVPYLQDKSFVE